MDSVQVEVVEGTVLGLGVRIVVFREGGSEREKEWGEEHAFAIQFNDKSMERVGGDARTRLFKGRQVYVQHM